VRSVPASESGRLVRFDVAGAERGASLRYAWEGLAANAAHAGAAFFAALDDGVLSAGGDGFLRRWRPPERKFANASAKGAPCEALASVVNGRVLLARGGEIEVWSSDLALAKSFHAQKNVAGLTWLSHERCASSGEDGTVRVWDVASGRELERIEFAARGERPGALAPAGERDLAVATDAGAVELFRLAR
jgi:WD40 repeat protein